jgi:hypothetical protein
MAKSASEFQVDTSPTKEVVVDSITRDATDEECIFDLIDNSIDAARNVIFSNISPKLRNELPSGYAGYEIKLKLDSANLNIADNCGGIPIEALKKVALRFGEQSDQKMGIGAFGVGLNRALFRLGGFAQITTETGRERAEVTLEKDKYLHKSNNWMLPGEKLPITGKIGTTIEIRQLPTGTSSHFGDPRWVAALEHQIGRRYGRFVQKGLVLSVNGKKVANEEAPIREDGIYEVREKFLRTSDGVVVHIRYGQHKLHKFPGEKGNSDEQNRRLTPQYGWTILCNDRAVLLSDKTNKTGWEITKFHSDFYGFVGYVNFVSEDPRKLPWNTTKTDVDLNNVAYQEAIKDMRRFTKEWRSAANQRKRKALPAPVPPKKAKKTEPQASKSLKQKASPPLKPKIVTKQDHNQFREVLPNDINEIHCYDKHLALVRQAKALDMATFSYPGLALLRMLFETSTVQYMDRLGRLDELRNFALDRRKKDGWNPSSEQEKRATISIEEMIAYFSSGANVWGDAKAAYMRHIVGKMGKHIPTMNSALHHPIQTITNTHAIEIRNEVLPLLRHLIEK